MPGILENGKPAVSDAIEPLKSAVHILFPF
jgi:hypothetical protein